MRSLSSVSPVVRDKKRECYPTGQLRIVAADFESILPRLQRKVLIHVHMPWNLWSYLCTNNIGPSARFETGSPQLGWYYTNAEGLLVSIWK